MKNVNGTIKRRAIVHIYNALASRVIAKSRCRVKKNTRNVAENLLVSASDAGVKRQNKMVYAQFAVKIRRGPVKKHVIYV